MATPSSPSPDAKAEQHASSAHGDVGPDAAGIYSVKFGEVSPPKLVHSVDPEYTDDARRRKLQGTCVLRIVIDAKGQVQSVDVDKSVGDGWSPEDEKYAPKLDQNAIKAVKKYRFKPAIYKNQPVPVRVGIEVSFRIY